MFSSRTNWHRQQNKLTELLESRRKSGKPIHDLTISNPTECGFNYPEKETLSALSSPDVLIYKPDPRGFITAREAVVRYYQTKNIVVDPGDLFLTASTSEAYSFIFKLLCNPDDAILTPIPSYPLFEYLAQINDVKTQEYRLVYDHGWQIDLESIANSISNSTKAIILINPHNPTGMFFKKNEYLEIQKIAREKNLALIVDEVFIDYPHDDSPDRYGSAAGSSEVLTFTLNGISKMCGLPQVKLGWIAVSGEQRAKSEAVERLEILCDTFLSVNTPAQVALPKLLQSSESIRKQILQCIKSNYSFLSLLTTHHSPINILSTGGGWYAILKVPRTKSDEDWALELLDSYGIYLFPGYFFDFEEEGYLVVSLLVEEEKFQSAIKGVEEFIAASMH